MGPRLRGDDNITADFCDGFTGTVWGTAVWSKSKAVCDASTFAIFYFLLTIVVEGFGGNFVGRIWLHFCFGILFVVREA